MNARLAKPIQHDLVYSLGLSVSTNAGGNTGLYRHFRRDNRPRGKTMTVIAAQKH